MTYTLPAGVESYWEALRGERLMPLRSEVDPSGFAGALDHTFLLERTGRDRARVRLAGLWLTDAMGMEVRGMPATSLFAPGLRPAAAQAMETVFSGPSILRITLSWAGRASGRMVLLPLRSDLGDVTRALGCIGAPSRPDLSASRFAIRAIERTELLGASVERHELAEDAVPFDAPARGRGHLWLVKG